MSNWLVSMSKWLVDALPPWRESKEWSKQRLQKKFVCDCLVEFWVDILQSQVTKQFVYILFAWLVYGFIVKTLTFENQSTELKGMIVLHQNGIEFNRESIGND